MAPASTGSDSRSSIEVTKTVQINKGNLSRPIPRARIFNIVVMKFIDPAIEPAPARCKLNIARSTESPLWDMLSDSGG
jgi:hypothetical protein